MLISMRRTSRMSLCLALCLALLLAAAPALAQTETWEEVPENLISPLRDAGYDPADALCGASQKRPGLATYTLVALKSGQGRTLVGITETVYGWQVEALGEKMLLPGRDFRILFKEGERSPVFVEYAPIGGVIERYGFWPSFNGLWVVERYERELADGTGTLITNEYGTGFCTGALGENLWDNPVYPANWIGWARYLDGVEVFPTTVEAVRTLADASWQRFDKSDLVMLYGSVNLREKPTGGSKSLGRYFAGALAHKLGEKPGKDAPWVHVRVGEVEGYVSGVYVRTPCTGAYVEALWHTPLPLARMNGSVTLRREPSDASDALAVLDAGALAQVMGETDDGWLHVSVPGGEPGWEMDADAPTGYVRQSEVTQGTAVTLGI